MKVMLSFRDLVEIWHREYMNEYIKIKWSLKTGRVTTSEEPATNYDVARNHNGYYINVVSNKSVSDLLFQLIDTAYIFEDSVEVY